MGITLIRRALVLRTALVLAGRMPSGPLQAPLVLMLREAGIAGMKTLPSLVFRAFPVPGGAVALARPVVVESFVHEQPRAGRISAKRCNRRTCRLGAKTRPDPPTGAQAGPSLDPLLGSLLISGPRGGRLPLKASLALLGRLRRTLRKATARIAEDELDASVLLPAGRRVVRSHGIAFTQAAGSILVLRHSAGFELHGDSLGAPLGESLVVVIGAAAVSVPVNDDPCLGIGLQVARQPVQRKARTGLEGSLARIEQHIAESHHHPAIGFLGLQILQLPLCVGELLLRRQSLIPCVLCLGLGALCLRLGALCLRLRVLCFTFTAGKQDVIPLILRTSHFLLSVRLGDSCFPGFRMSAGQICQMI